MVDDKSDARQEQGVIRACVRVSRGIRHLVLRNHLDCFSYIYYVMCVRQLKIVVKQVQRKYDVKLLKN